MILKNHVIRKGIIHHAIDSPLVASVSFSSKLTLSKENPPFISVEQAKRSTSVI